jgi:hypothetical protein
MEVEDEDSILERLFFKKYGRALPEKEKEKENVVDNIKFVIDLTDDTDEMEVATPVEVAVVKTEPIEIPEIVSNVNVANINNFANAKGVYNESGIRVSRRLELIELAKARKAINEFGKSLRKKNVIPEKEAPEDTDMAEDTSVNTVETVEQTIAASEAAIAESDALIEANRKEFAAEFGDTNLDEFD